MGYDGNTLIFYPYKSMRITLISTDSLDARLLLDFYLYLSGGMWYKGFHFTLPSCS